MSKHSVLVQWSEGDNAYIATVPELPGLSAFGSSQEEAVMSGSRFSVQARPGATRLKHSKDHAGFLNVSLYNWALQSQVWARGSKVIICLYS